MIVIDEKHAWAQETYCLSCKKRLLVEQSDVKLDDAPAISDVRTTPFFFICSSCGANNPLYGVPASVQSRFFRK